jgi:hypothetical protein
MLVEFQQALADLTASPELCIRVRQDSSVLQQRYELTDREWRRLVRIVRHPGMACACMVYRANRLAPLALNVPQTCRALGKELRAVVSEYWTSFPEGNVHFFIETDRFCRFLKTKMEEGRTFPAGVAPVLAQEADIVADALQKSMTEATPHQVPPLSLVRGSSVLDSPEEAESDLGLPSPEVVRALRHR